MFTALLLVLLALAVLGAIKVTTFLWVLVIALIVLLVFNRPRV